ncbi:MAG: hypothetical protein ACK6BQ_04325 [Bacteroidota bacterium]|jgi:hypothetical protein
MATPVRFPNGVTNVSPTDLMGQMGVLDPTQYIVDFNDFMSFNATSGEEYTITNTGAATEALSSAHGPGGVLLLSNAAADNDLVTLQRPVEAFKFTSGKKVWFASRLKILDAGSDVTQSDVFVGLIITDTTLEAGITDGVYFTKADGVAGTINFISTMNSTATTQSAVATFVHNTFIELGFYYDGGTALEVYVNNAKVATVTVALGTTLVNDEELTVTFGIQNGEAVSKVMAIDYHFACQER